MIFCGSRQSNGVSIAEKCDFIDSNDKSVAGAGNKYCQKSETECAAAIDLVVAMPSHAISGNHFYPARDRCGGKLPP
jgi:hypothetical protein